MNIGWPQAIYLALVMLGIGLELARHGEAKKPGRHNAWATMIGSAIVLLLLWWGGFFRQ